MTGKIKYKIEKEGFQKKLAERAYQKLEEMLWQGQEHQDNKMLP